MRVESDATSAERDGASLPWRAMARSALRHWEPRRAAYNLALALVTGATFAAHAGAWRPPVSTDLGLVLFVLAVLANLAYCAAYPLDLFVQASAIESWLRRARRAVFGLGLGFAAVLAHFFARGLLGVD